MGAFFLTPLLPGRSVSSHNLAPGDVYEFSDPSLNQVTCDSILLSGDCIVNESMLTGTYSLIFTHLTMEGSDME